jgi:hypothetical protein
MAGRRDRRATGNVATLTTATTGAALWGMRHFFFHGELPAEIYLWVQLAVPAALGAASAEWSLRRAARRNRDRAPAEMAEALTRNTES